MVACALLALALAAPAGKPPARLATPPNEAPNPRLEMVVENRGKIVMELYPQAAPKTVAHILDLVNQKFYDGILFHRVIAEFVAQAGDPHSKKYRPAQLHGASDRDIAEKFMLGAGGSGKTVRLEPKLPHERGTVGLARSSAPDSGDSQFFFNLVDNHSLDYNYCVFGKVVKGLDVMDKIELGDRIKSVRVAGKGSSGKSAPGKPKTTHTKAK
jgi:peptidyl-prolyl cis-trans isomerase B (cyclophilin B)